MVMIISLLLAAVGCSNGLVSNGENDLSGGEIPTQETTQETSPGKNKPENSNYENSENQEQNEAESPEEVPPEIEQTETEKSEVEKPEENQSETETPEKIPPTVEQPEVSPVVEQLEEPQETEPPIVPQNVILVINELRTEYASTIKRAEYIEFKVLNEGNLNGISLHIMNDVENPFVYNFPDINVSNGEYITLHMQTLDSKCKDELEDNLSLSGGNDACPTARDLWVDGNNEYLEKTDIVFLQDAEGKIIDAIVMNGKPGNTWDKDFEHFAQITEYLFNQGTWESKDGERPTPFDAVDTSVISNTTRSVCRYEWRQNHFNKTDWYVTNSGFTSPGLPNK